MTAQLAVLNDLQREFATRARDETKGILVDGYILPWTRGPLRKASSLDPIYQAVGQANLNYQNVRTLIGNLAPGKRQKYRRTLAWLRDQVLNGDYVQQGNSCGAWSLTHWRMRKEHRYLGGQDFRNRAVAEYARVQFQTADWRGPGPRPAEFNDWLNPPNGAGPYSSPWKIVQGLGITTLKIDPAARAFANAGGNPLAVGLSGMLTLVNALRPAGAPVVADGDLSALPIGSGAIIIALNPVVPTELHYLLLGHTTAGWEIYNSNSHKLNPTVLAACPQFNNPFVTDLKNNNGSASGNETWSFLGVFIVD